MEKIIAYKAFHANWTAYRGFQYQVGETYELDDKITIKINGPGFHACLHPIDCDDYYDITEWRDGKPKFAQVILHGDIVKSEWNSCIVGRKITIAKEIDLATFFQGKTVRKSNGETIVFGPDGKITNAKRFSTWSLKSCKDTLYTPSRKDKHHRSEGLEPTPQPDP